MGYKSRGVVLVSVLILSLGLASLSLVGFQSAMLSHRMSQNRIVHLQQRQVLSSALIEAEYAAKKMGRFYTDHHKHAVSCLKIDIACTVKWLDTHHDPWGPKRIYEIEAATQTHRHAKITQSETIAITETYLGGQRLERWSWRER